MRRTAGGKPRSWLICAMILMLGLAMAACGRDADNRSEPYPEDGYLGLSQTNPNLLPNSTGRTYYADSQVIKRTLMSIDGIQQVSSFANGPHVFVYLTLEEELSDEEKDQIRRKAEKALSFNNPRFDYKVMLR